MDSSQVILSLGLRHSHDKILLICEVSRIPTFFGVPGTGRMNERPHIKATAQDADVLCIVLDRPKDIASGNVKNWPAGACE